MNTATQATAKITGRASNSQRRFTPPSPPQHPDRRRPPSRPAEPASRSARSRPHRLRRPQPDHRQVAGAAERIPRVLAVQRGHQLLLAAVRPPRSARALHQTNQRSSGVGGGSSSFAAHQASASASSSLATASWARPAKAAACSQQNIS